MPACAGTNLQPRCCPPLHLLAFCAGIHARLCRHQSAGELLLAAASFGLPRRYSCLLAGTNLQPNCCPPLHLSGPRCCPLLRRFGLPRLYSCFLAGINLQPRCCPPLHLFGLPRRYSSLLAGTNLQPNCCPPLHVLGPRCCPPLHLFGLPRK
jgi:hypothetical protein